MCRKDNTEIKKVEGRHLLKLRIKKIRTGIYVKLRLYATGTLLILVLCL